MCGDAASDPSEHDKVPRGREVSLGAVYREDGQPSDLTLELMGWTRERWEEQNRLFRFDGTSWVER